MSALGRYKLPSVSTVWRILRRNGLITPQPRKRPRSSFIRFHAQLPNAEPGCRTGEQWARELRPASRG